MKLRAITQSARNYSLKSKFEDWNVGAIPFTKKAELIQSEPWSKRDFAIYGAIGLGFACISFNYVSSNAVDGVFHVKPSDLLINLLLPFGLVSTAAVGASLYMTKHLRGGYLLAQPRQDKKEERKPDEGQKVTPVLKMQEVLEDNDVPYFKYKIATSVPVKDSEGNLVKDKNGNQLERQIEVEKTRKGFTAIGFIEGKVINTYQIAVTTGFKSKDIKNYSRDLKLKPGQKMTVIDNAGNGNIGIEVPANRSKEERIVYFKSLIESQEWLDFAERSQLPVLLGEDKLGNALYDDATEMVHCLDGGLTGNGKSAGLATKIMSLILSKTPQQVKLSVHDPKGYELTWLEGSKHLLHEVSTDMEVTARHLEDLVRENKDRGEIFRKSKVRNLAEYNKKADIPLPYIIVIIDELFLACNSTKGVVVSEEETRTAGDLISEYSAEAATVFRASGILLWTATQYSLSKSFHPMLLANLVTRTCYKVGKDEHSRVILGEAGEYNARNLLGMGDGYYLKNGADSPVRFHGAYIPTDELENYIHQANRNNLKVIEEKVA